MRVALRIARRSSRQAVGRSALIVALISLPVAGMTAVCLVTASMTPTGAEQATVLLGQAGASVSLVADGRISQAADGTQWESTAGVSEAPNSTALKTVLPKGEPVIPVLDTAATVRTRAGEASFTAAVGAVWSEALQGRFRMLAGHAPRSVDEVLATPAALARIGAHVGDEVPVLLPRSATVRVVGTIDPRWADQSYEALYGLPGAFGTPTDILDAPDATAYLPAAHVDQAQVRALNRRGALVVSRQVLLDPPPQGMYDTAFQANSPYWNYLYGSVIVGFALLEVLLLAGAAFLVGARSQERALATVASVGARRGTLVAIISASGLVLGAVSGVAGVAAGFGAGTAFMGLTGDGSATRYWGFHAVWPVFVAIAFGSIVVGWLGAIVPAIRASRIDVVAALRGARRPMTPRKRRPIAGVVIVALGVAATVVGGLILIALQTDVSGRLPSHLLGPLATALLLGGPTLVILGLLLTSGLILRLLARWSGGASVPLRLATRDAARNAGRSIPAIAAVLVTVFVAVFAMTMIASSEGTSSRHYEYGARLGQLVLPLAYSDTGGATHELKAADVSSAARAALTSPKIAVLRAVPDGHDYYGPDSLPAGVQAAALVPHLNVPAANQCPADQTAADYDAKAGEGTATQSFYFNNDPRCATRMTSSGPTLWVMDAAELALVTGRGPSAAVRAALTDGKAMVLNPLYAQDGRVTLSWWTAGRWQSEGGAVQKTPPARTTDIAAVSDTLDPLLPYGAVISPDTATRLGLPFAAQTVLADPLKPATQQQLDALTGMVDARVGVPGAYYAVAESGPPTSSSALSWALLGLSGLIAIGATGVAVGLARADGRRDQAALAAIGASPRTTRSFGFWQAVMLTGVGTVLGAGVGLIPAIALTLPGSATMLTPPWLQIAATAVLLPAIIGFVVWALPVRRRATPLRAAMA